MQDINEAKAVEFTVDDKGKIWVNVNGICALRVRKADAVYIDNGWNYAEEEVERPGAQRPKKVIGLV